MLRLVSSSDKFKLMDSLADKIRRVITGSGLAECDVSTVLHLLASETDAEAVEREDPEGDDAEPQVVGDLETRLARMLATVIDATLMTVRDTMNDRPVELRVGSFLPDLGNKAAELLEEAGH